MIFPSHSKAKVNFIARFLLLENQKNMHFSEKPVKIPVISGIQFFFVITILLRRVFTIIAFKEKKIFTHVYSCTESIIPTKAQNIICSLAPTHEPTDFFQLHKFILWGQFILDMTF